MKPTIVTLSPSTEATEVVSFGEAFGEFSEARGRGRNRRQKRKLDRIAKRRERKKARQQMRAEQQESRQLRKDTRKSRRVLRKKMGDEPETEMDEATTSETGTQNSDYSQEQGGGEPLNEVSDSAPDNQGSGEGEYQTTQDDYVQEGDDYAEEDGGNYEEGESDEESGFTGDSGADGTIEMSPDDVQWNEYFSSAEGKAKINPKVKQLSRRIEQNKELISRFQKQIEKAKRGKNENNEAKQNKVIAGLRSRIQERKVKLAELETLLASYSKFDGEYSDARGGRKAIARRKAEVRQAKRMARKERQMAKKQNRLNRQNGGSETPVDTELNPKFSEQKIEVEAEEMGSFNGVGTGETGTGLIGLDNTEDVDAPEVRKFDLKFSSADGNKPKLDLKNIAIGVGVGVLAVLLIKKLTKK